MYSYSLLPFILFSSFHPCLLAYHPFFHLLSSSPSQEAPEEERDQDQAILPGGDPDAGMPAEQAEIHGIDRAPASEDQDQDQELYPVVTDSLDNTDEGDPVVGGTHDTSDGNVTHPPPSAD